jgi:hypothetical protein
MANEDLDPLDDTRIHPESYPAAIALARELRSAAGMSDEEAVEHALAEPRVSGGDLLCVGEGRQRRVEGGASWAPGSCSETRLARPA